VGKTLVWQNGKLLDKHDAVPRIRRFGRAPAVIMDAADYRSTITNENISGRVAHRRHLKEHDMVEIGDNRPAWMDTHLEVMAEAKATGKTAEQVNPTVKPKDEVPFSFEELSDRDLDALDAE